MKRDLTDFETLRAQELLVQRATEGLDDDDNTELDTLGVRDVEGFEVAAAAVDIATVPREALPPAVADKVFAAALEVVGGRTPAGAAASTAPAVPAVAAVLPDAATPRSITRAHAEKRTPRRTQRVMMFAGWMTAAAAFAVAAGLWLTADRTPTVTPAAAREELATTDDAVTWTWTASPDSPAPNVAGDVVWSTHRQHGFVRLHDLPANVTSRSRYQLWIFDEGRDDRFPVDGGLFDAAPGETLVAIDPRIPIANPTRFLITEEAPNGAVVSDRKHVVAIATAPSR